MAAAMLVLAAVLVAAAAGVSVDPDLQEQPLQAEAEDVFVFPSMRLSSPLALVQIRASNDGSRRFHWRRPFFWLKAPTK